jgi:hypothetical protein
MRVGVGHVDIYIHTHLILVIGRSQTVEAIVVDCAYYQKWFKSCQVGQKSEHKRAYSIRYETKGTYMSCNRSESPPGKESAGMFTPRVPKR